MTERTRIFIEDIRKSGHCTIGARSFFTAHGIDFRDLLRNGITIEKLRSLKDGLADQVVERTLARDAGGGKRD